MEVPFSSEGEPESRLGVKRDRTVTFGSDTLDLTTSDDEEGDKPETGRNRKLQNIRRNVTTGMTGAMRMRQLRQMDVLEGRR